jgi:hypothetical protein
MPVNRQRHFHSQKRMPLSRQLLFPVEMPLPVGRPLHFGKKMRAPARRQPGFFESSALGARPMERPLTKTAQALDTERFFWRGPGLLLGVLPAMTVSMRRTLGSLRFPTKLPVLVQVAKAILEAMTRRQACGLAPNEAQSTRRDGPLPCNVSPASPGRLALVGRELPKFIAV